jgi:hypothetical protein
MSGTGSLEQEKWEFQKQLVLAQIARNYDLEYVKLTIVLVLLVIVIFYITCRVGKEKYTEPQLGLTTHDQKRSDAAFDKGVVPPPIIPADSIVWQ